MKHYWCEYWTKMEGTNHYITACGVSTVKQKQEKMWAKGDSWTDDIRKVDCPECLKIIKEKLFPMEHIKEIWHIPHLGGGCSVDAIELPCGKVLTISEDIIVMWRSKEEMENAFFVDDTAWETDVIGELPL